MKKYAKTSKTKLKKKGKVCETYTKLYISTKSTKKYAKECKVWNRLKKYAKKKYIYILI